MQFSFMTEPQAGGTYDDLVRLARWAESIGFDSFARSDHYLNMDESVPATDALTTLAGLGRDTSTIKLTVLVTPLTFRHPAVLAKTAATVDQMSAGRLELGVGTGWMEPEHERFGIGLPDLWERFSRLYETLAYLRSCFGSASSGFSGRHYNLEPMDVLPKPTGDLPLIVGGSGPKKTPSIAGRFADEYNMFTTDTESLRARLRVMSSAAVDAGRDPEAIRISFVGYPVMGDDQADYRDRLAARSAARGMETGEYEAMLVARNLPHGTAEQVAEQFAAYARNGVDRYYLQVYAPLTEIDTDDVERVFNVVKDT
jgi:F420-dependent oxidoreductase-like protein